MIINFFGDFVAQDVTKLNMSKDLKDLISCSDFNVVNFEAPIDLGKGNNVPIHKSGPCNKQSIFAPKWLSDNGMNIFTLSNNHIMDQGILAIKKTICELGEKKTLGVGNGIDCYKPIIIYRNGLKVALFNMAELQFGMIHDLWTQQDKIGCAWINYNKVNCIIREAKKDNDYIIMIAHAGLENVDIPLPEWRDRYRELIDEGCDAVIGGHTHTSQGYELYHGKPIFYSLGNFFFQKKKKMDLSWYQGECVTINVGKEGLTFKISGTKYVNNNIMLQENNNWQNKIEYLNSLLNNKENYIKKINKICISKLDDYNYMCSSAGYIHMDKHIIKSILKLLLKRCDNYHMLNNLQCESHRWCFARGIRLINKK